MKALKIFLIFFLVCLLFIPVLQATFSFFREKELTGYFDLQPKPSIREFTWEQWENGAFQTGINQRLEDHVGFRKSLIRIRNEMDYRVYGMINVPAFIQGKNGYLFEEEYIYEYTGKYFIGKKPIESAMYKLKYVQDSLRAMGIDLLVVIEPGKASLCSEYIPDHYHPEKRSLTNYQYLIKQMNELQIPYLDLNQYFLQIKDTCRYPLFPPYGMHWSMYGEFLAVDTLIKYMEQVRQTDIPDFSMKSVVISDSLQMTDNDIGEMINTIFPLPKVNMAYPVIEFEKDPAKKILNILTIADSYYLNVRGGYSYALFNHDEFWFYNSKVYPENYSAPPVDVDHSKLPEKIKTVDVILLMSSEINLHCLFWNFIDQVYAVLNPSDGDPWIHFYENKIRNQREWFAFIAKEAEKEFLSIRQKVRMDAEYLLYLNFDTLSPKTMEDSIHYIMHAIRIDPDWLSSTSRKATERQIPIEQMIRKEAEYVYSAGNINQ